MSVELFNAVYHCVYDHLLKWRKLKPLTIKLNDIQLNSVKSYVYKIVKIDCVPEDSPINFEPIISIENKLVALFDYRSKYPGIDLSTITSIIIVHPNTEKTKEALKTVYKNINTTIKCTIMISEHDLLGTKMSINNYIPGTKFYNFTYPLFKTVIPEHYLVPKHEILSSEEKELLPDALKIVPAKALPHIRLFDPMCIWIGAIEGDIIKITRSNYTTGLSIAYRQVVSR